MKKYWKKSINIVDTILYVIRITLAIILLPLVILFNIK